MKFELILLALLILFQNISSNKNIFKRMSKAALAMRKIVQNKEKKMRKLQDISALDSAYIYTIPTDLPPEAERTTSPPIIIDNTNSTTKPPEQSQEATGNTGTALQIKKIHNYKRKNNGIIFNVFFYFLNRPIVERIILRLSIMYRRGRLRNLDDSIPGESVATPCIIRNEYKDKLGTMGTGDNVDYDCTTPTQTDADIENAAVDTSFPMVVGNETMEFSEVRFEPDAIKEASNIADEKVVKELKIATFDNVKLNLPMEKDKFKMNGKLIINDGNVIQNGKSFNMKFYDISKGDYSNSIACIPTCTGEQCDIECDTTDNPLRFYVRNLTIAKYDGDSNTYITINTEGEQDDKIVSSISNSATYRKNSSGLSGGAIAGIVIACVVVLAAASIAAIMLRKPSKPPIDNTTIVGLKNVENL